MEKPTIHLNGTSTKELIAGYMKAYDAARTLFQVLHECVPNGRDYYPQGPEKFKKACEEHISRAKAADGIRKEMEEMVMYLNDEAERRPGDDHYRC